MLLQSAFGVGDFPYGQAMLMEWNCSKWDNGHSLLPGNGIRCDNSELPIKVFKCVGPWDNADVLVVSRGSYGRVVVSPFGYPPFICGHFAAVTAVDWEPYCLATTARDGRVRLWNVNFREGGLGADIMLQGHAYGTAAAFFSDFLAVGCADGLIRVIHVGTGREIVKLRGHFDEVTDLKLNPDRSQLYSASRDGTILVWDVKAISDWCQEKVKSATTKPD